MLELAILGLLKERAMHGYELRKQLGQKLGFFWTVSFGSLYPTLKKLERRGVVEKFFPGDQTSRRKQVYRITAAGEAEFLELLTEGAHSAWEEDKFPLRLAFFRHVGPETRIRLLERRKAYLEDKLDEGRRVLNRARRGMSDTYTLSLMRHGVETTEHDLAWLDTLITAERATLSDGKAAGAAAPAGAIAEPGAPEDPRPTEELQTK
ncbi:MAG TPA: PadR family transcriptional regulator [Egibacteraceae bacterium]|nr:PadR family transcriptional regulator [Egibacteraceae bacterium]